MGINYNYSKEDLEESSKIKEEAMNIKAPKFYLNKEFPNYYNISLEDILQNLLKSNYDLLENKEITSSLSKQFKLLYKKNSDISNNSKDIINNINNNNLNEIKENIINNNENKINLKEFSFSQGGIEENKKSEKNWENEPNNIKGNNNVEDIKLFTFNNFI